MTLITAASMPHTQLCMLFHLAGQLSRWSWLPEIVELCASGLSKTTTPFHIPKYWIFFVWSSHTHPFSHHTLITGLTCLAGRAWLKTRICNRLPLVGCIRRSQWHTGKGSQRRGPLSSVYLHADEFLSAERDRLRILQPALGHVSSVTRMTTNHILSGNYFRLVPYLAGPIIR